jgi:hypothetical protein
VYSVCIACCADGSLYTGLARDPVARVAVHNNGTGAKYTASFSGVPGFSTTITKNDTRTVRVLIDARITIVHQAKVESMQNGTVGFFADNGAGLTMVNSMVTGNTVRDLQMMIGVRADIRTSTIGTVTCDATVLVRGTHGIICPQP